MANCPTTTSLNQMEDFKKVPPGRDFPRTCGRFSGRRNNVSRCWHNDWLLFHLGKKVIQEPVPKQEPQSPVHSQSPLHQCLHHPHHLRPPHHPSHHYHGNHPNPKAHVRHHLIGASNLAGCRVSAWNMRLTAIRHHCGCQHSTPRANRETQAPPLSGLYRVFIMHQARRAAFHPPDANTLLSPENS